MALRESGEDYLEAILVLEKSSGFVRAVDISEHLEVSKPSVSKALGNLERAGFITVVKHDVRLTEAGRTRAEAVLEKHEFFFDVLRSAGVEADTASEEACRMEHCLSEDSFRKLARQWDEAREAGVGQAG